MSSVVQPSLFDFVSDFADEVKAGKIEELATLEESSGIIVFCESFFEQFFATVGLSIDGFNLRGKRAAAGLAETMTRSDETAPVRALVSLYERFCDMYVDLVGTSFGDGTITYQVFHADYMRRLLKRALDWVTTAGHHDVIVPLTKAIGDYDEAMKKMKW